MADDEGGDPVCWLEQLCPECGAMPSETDDARCWRCGTPLPERADEHAADGTVPGA